ATATAAAEPAEAAAAACGIERAHHRRQQARHRARLDDRGVAPRLDRLRLLALQRLVGGNLAQLADVDLRQILRAGDAGPSRSAAARGAAGEDEAGLGVLVVAEEPLRVGDAVGLIRLRDVTGGEHPFFLADVDRLFHPRRAFARSEAGG